MLYWSYIFGRNGDKKPFFEVPHKMQNYRFDPLETFPAVRWTFTLFMFTKVHADFSLVAYVLLVIAIVIHDNEKVTDQSQD